MIKVFSILAFTLSVSSAYAGIGFDGCYQLYKPSSMYPAFCLEGTAEEGISGAGVRLVIFGTNTDKVVHCSKSSGAGMTFDSFTYELNGKKELILENVTSTDGHKEGDAVFGRTRLKFIEVDRATSDRLMRTAGSDAACSNGWNL